MNDKIVEIIVDLLREAQFNKWRASAVVAQKAEQAAQEIRAAMWTPVEDGLPEKKGDYWVTFMVDDKRIYSQDHFNGNEWLSSISNIFTHYQLIVGPND